MQMSFHHEGSGIILNDKIHIRTFAGKFFVFRLFGEQYVHVHYDFVINFFCEIE